MGQLILPTGPSNLFFDEGVQTLSVDSDMYNICERIREVSDRLKIIFQKQGDLWQYVIMEHCEDGIERLVMKVGPQHEIKELDGRVIQKLQRMQRLDFKTRIRQWELKVERERKAREAEEEERRYDEIGAPMLHLLYKTGFADSPVSYPKAGVATGGKKRK